MALSNGSLPTSKHFTLECLADGVYVAVARPGGGAGSNAGLIDLGGVSLVLDTFDTHTAAQDLRAAAETIFNQPVRYVVITHAHGDHWSGNQVFDDSAIIASQACFTAMQPIAADLRAVAGDPSIIQGQLRQAEADLAATSDAAAQASIGARIARIRHVLDSLPNLRIRFPDLLFEGTLFIHGTRRTAELEALPPAHTQGDVVLRLPADGIAFIGDLGFFHSQPYMGSCEPDGWLTALQSLQAEAADVFVPGHGPVGARAELLLEAEYIRMVRDLVSEAVTRGDQMADILATSLPAPFDAWQADTRPRWERNVQALYRMATGD